MFDSNDIFTRTPTSTNSVLHSVFSVFASQWQTFVAIAFCKLLSIGIFMGVVFGLVFLWIGLWIGTAVQCLLPHYYNGDSSPTSRALMDHVLSVPSSSATHHRFLSDIMTYNYDNDGSGGYFDDDLIQEPYQCMDAINDQINEGWTAFTSLCIFCILGLIFIVSIFDSTMVHAIAHTYSGGIPSVANSVKYGIRRMCGVIVFNGLYSILLLVLWIGGLVWCFMGYYQGMGPSFGKAFWTLFFLLTTSVVLGSTMVAAVPSIVVENISGIAAFGKSWNLCKRSICFVFCTLFCFHLLVFIANVVFNVMMKTSGGGGFVAAILYLLHFCFSVVVQIMAVAITIVIYISLRVQSPEEELTQAKLGTELGDCMAVPVVELSNDEYVKATQIETTSFV